MDFTLAASLLWKVRLQNHGHDLWLPSNYNQVTPTALGLLMSSRTGMSESLLKEVARFNISVLLVEPGAFKTNLLFSMVKPATGHTPEYEEVEKVLQCFTDVRTQKGDPDKAAARIIEAVVGEGTGGALKGKALRLPLGEDCVQRMDAKIENLIADLRMSREIALSTDFDTD